MKLVTKALSSQLSSLDLENLVFELRVEMSGAIIVRGEVEMCKTVS